EAVAHATLTTPAGIIAGGDAVDQEHDFPVKGTAYSLLYTTETPQEAGDYIQKLVDGGGSMAMPFERAPWGDWYGQVFDRFGVMWSCSCEATRFRAKGPRCVMHLDYVRHLRKRTHRGPLALKRVSSIVASAWHPARCMR